MKLLQHYCYCIAIDVVGKIRKLLILKLLLQKLSVTINRAIASEKSTIVHPCTQTLQSEVPGPHPDVHGHPEIT